MSSVLVAAVLLCGTPAIADVAGTPQVELQLGIVGGFTHVDSESVETLGPRVAIGHGWSVIEVQAEYEHVGMYRLGPSGSDPIGTAKRLAMLGQLDLFALHRGAYSLRYFAELGAGRQSLSRNDDHNHNHTVNRHDMTLGIGWDIEMKISRGGDKPMVGGVSFVGRVTAAGRRDPDVAPRCAASCARDSRAHDLGMTGTASLTLSW